MKISIAKRDLEAALSVTKISVSGDSDLSGHYLFRYKGGKIEILSYHQRVFSLAPVVSSVEGEEGEAFTVEAWRLDKWVSGVTDGVLMLTSDGAGDVTCSGPRSKIKLRSLDPSKFPYWDKLVASAKPSGSTLPTSLSRALSISRWFVSSDDTSKPELCQIDSVKGVFFATDRRSFSSAEIPGLENLSVRIPSKDVGLLVKFLTEKGTVEGGAIEIREASRPPSEGGGAALFFRPDGSYFGVVRPNTELPPLSKEYRDAAPDFSITLDHAELTSAVSVLSAAAPRGHERISFKIRDGAIAVVMPSEAGGTTESSLTLAVLKGPPDLSVEFQIDYSYVQGLFATFGGEQLELGCSQRAGGGWCTFAYFDAEEDKKAHAAIGELTEIGELEPGQTADTLEAYKKLRFAALRLKANRYFTVVGWRV